MEDKMERMKNLIKRGKGEAATIILVVLGMALAIAFIAEAVK